MNTNKDLTGRSGEARTPNPRFWRPVLYQLSYTPKALKSLVFLVPQGEQNVSLLALC
jgi:hypothetical protein